MKVERTECPICHHEAVRLNSGRSGWFWKCEGTCAEFFPDNDGELVAPNECPICGELRVTRHASSQLPDVHYHKCSACETFYQDGEDGKPGARFTDQDQ